MNRLNENKLIEVCSSCKRACCWYGEFMCENSHNASTELKTVKELRKLKTGENEHYWSDEYMKKISTKKLYSQNHNHLTPLMSQQMVRTDYYVQNEQKTPTIFQSPRDLFVTPEKITR